MKSSQSFWDKEYKTTGKQNGHLALSTNPSEDLEKFVKWQIDEYGKKYLNPLQSVTDLGCGNGRNLIYLAENFGMRGTGFDISSEAISQAKKLSADLPIQYSVQSIAKPFSVPDNSQTLLLDMMTSHFLKSDERLNLLSEIKRMLKPDGFLFFKTFLLDEDSHAARLLRDHPGSEAGSYIHPEIGVEEHVFTEDEIITLLSADFYIHKITKSHRHLARNAKRRSISVYAQVQK